jgi:hypothetical protein
MTRFGLTGATAVALTLALAAPVMADNSLHARRADNGHHAASHHAASRGPMHSAVPAPDAYAYAEPRLPVENALRWGYSQGYSNYPSGWGGLYGDGRYPGNTVSNANHPF